ATIAVSQPVVDANARYFRAEWDVIPNGVDTSFFRSTGEGRRPTDALTEHPRLLFLGRIEPRNGLGTLLDAMPRILARFPGAALGRAGVEKAARFAWPRIARAELAVYERVLGRSARAAARPATDPRYVRAPMKTSVMASTSR